MITIEVAGFMGAIGLRLNPISAVTIITAVGVSVEFTVQVCFVRDEELIKLQVSKN